MREGSIALTTSVGSEKNWKLEVGTAREESGHVLGGQRMVSGIQSRRRYPMGMSHKTQTLKFLAHAVHSDSCACCLSLTLVPFVTGSSPSDVRCQHVSALAP